MEDDEELRVEVVLKRLALQDVLELLEQCERVVGRVDALKALVRVRVRVRARDRGPTLTLTLTWLMKLCSAASSSWLGLGLGSGLGNPNQYSERPFSATSGLGRG